MERSEFLKNLAGIIAAPVLIKDFAPEAATELVKSVPPIAVDLHAIEDIGYGPGGERMTPAEVIRIYQQTGIIIYRNNYPETPTYQPITILDNGK